MMLERLLKFGIVGILNTIICVFIYYVAFEIYNFPLYLTYFGVYNFGIIISYFLNSKYTFNAKYSSKEYIMYTISYLIGFLVGYLLLLGISELYQTSTKMIRILIMIPPRIIITFLILHLFVYNKTE